MQSLIVINLPQGPPHYLKIDIRVAADSRQFLNRQPTTNNCSYAAPTSRSITRL